MKRRIIQALGEIERQHGVKIILASESGSRAWGFPSDDSDYDVRFIYAHRPDWYLTVGDKSDVIELPVDDILDINGWDLKKALQLMRKSNSPLMEWISSPIIYRIVPRASEALASLAGSAFLPETSCHHYLAMARKVAAQFDAEKKVRLKTYMYAVRPVLCCEWIIRNLSQPPMRMADLLAAIEIDKPVRENVVELISLKERHSEKYKVERSECLEHFIHNKISTLDGQLPGNPPRPDLERFDAVFRSIILGLAF